MLWGWLASAPKETSRRGEELGQAEAIFCFLLPHVYL